MEVVILAAGAGTRMNGHGSVLHKSLRRLMGMPVIERGIRAWGAAGARRITIVTGHAEEVLRQALGDGSRFGVELNYVYNPDWEQGNGSSLYAARHAVGSDHFIVAMADHWYEPTLARRLVEAGRAAGKSSGSLLCVDRSIDSPYDPADATKVVIAPDGRISSLDKALTDYNGLDCGVFLFSSDLFPALKDAFRANEYSLGAAAHRLAERGRLQALDVTGLLWEDLDTEGAVAEARGKIGKSLPGGDDGLVARFINRRLSIPLTSLAIRLRMAPNTVSGLAFGIAVAAGASFGFGQALVGGVLTQLASVIDGSDGEVARARFMTSRWGGLLDSMLDRLADGAIFIGVGAYLMRGGLSGIEALAVAGALASAPLSMMVKDRFQIATGRPWRSSRADGVARYMLATRDGRLFLVFAGGVSGQLLVVTAYIATAGLALLAWRLMLMRRELRPVATPAPVTRSVAPATVGSRATDSLPLPPPVMRPSAHSLHQASRSRNGVAASTAERRQR
jgi:CDP-L-myo-inositol myo-inositolphosphotransferase